MNIKLLLSFVALVGLLSGCSSTVVPEYSGPRTKSPKKATSRPYEINGICYYPQDYYELCEEGIASYYGPGDGFDGCPTATGERFDMWGMTGAHKTLPLPCVVLVRNLENGREAKLKVNDRGPFKPGRIIDVSAKAAQVLGFYNKGTARVRINTLVDESLSLPENACATGYSPKKCPPNDILIQEVDEITPYKPCEKAQPKARNLDDAVNSAFDKVTYDAPINQMPARVSITIEETPSFEEAMDIFQRVLPSYKNVSITKCVVNGRSLYRVAIPQVNDTKNAGNILNRLFQMGHSKAKITSQ